MTLLKKEFRVCPISDTSKTLDKRANRGLRPVADKYILLNQSTANRRALQANPALSSDFACPKAAIGLNNHPFSSLT
jgi:hypothetical protein